MSADHNIKFTCDFCPANITVQHETEAPHKWAYALITIKEMKQNSGRSSVVPDNNNIASRFAHICPACIKGLNEFHPGKEISKIPAWRKVLNYFDWSSHYG